MDVDEVVFSVEVLVDDRLHVPVLLSIQSESIVEASHNLHLYLFERVSRGDFVGLPKKKIKSWFVHYLLTQRDLLPAA